MPRPTLKEIGNSGVYGKEIIASDHNENYEDVLDYTEEVAGDLANHISSITAHLDEAIVNTSSVSGTKVKDALNSLLSALNSHEGSATAHTDASIVNTSNVSGDKVKDAINNLLSLLNSHETSQSAHLDSAIVNTSSVVGNKVKDALDTLLSSLTVHIENISAHGSDSIDNESSTVGGLKVSNALDELKAEIITLQPGGGTVNDALGVYKAVDNSNTNDYVATVAGAVLTNNIRLNLEVTNNNTGNSTLDFNSSGAKSIGWLVEGVFGEAESGMMSGITELQYLASIDKWIILTKEGARPTGEIEQSTAVDVIGGSTYQNSIVPSPMSKAVREGDTAYNSIKNPTFVNASEWTSASSTGAVSNNKYFNTGNGTSTVPRITQDTDLNLKVGDKIFMYAKARVTNANAEEILLRANGTVVADGDNISIVSTPTQDKWYELSGIFTVSTQTGNLQFYLRHRYSDLPTSNGKIMEVDGNVGVKAINLTVLNKQSYTQQEAFDRYGQKALDFGFNHVNGDMTTVSENLVSEIEIGGIDSDGNNIVQNASIRSKNVDKIPVNTEVTVSISGIDNIDVSSVLASYYTIGEQFIVREIESVAVIDKATFTTNEEAYGLRLYIFSVKNDDGDLTNQELQSLKVKLEIGDTATPYTKHYSETSTVANLKSLPNGVTDLDYPLDGETIRNVSGEYTLENADVTALTSTANVDYVRIAKKPDNIVFGNSFGTIANAQTILFPNYIAGAFTDSVNDIGEIFNLDGDEYGIVVAKGTYTDVNDARTDLVTNKQTKVIYQLATPVTEQGASTQHYADKNGLMIIDSNIVSPVTYVGSQNREQTVDNLGRAITRIDAEIDRVDTEIDRVDVLATRPKQTGGGYVINGNFDIWQRGTSFLNPINSSYIADRWQINNVATATPLFERQNAIEDGFEYSLRVEETVGGSSGNINVKQLIEDVEKFEGKLVTGSIRARFDSSVTGTLFIVRNGVGVASLPITGDGTIKTYTLSAILTSGITSLELRITLNTNGLSAGQGYSIQWTKLELGDTATEYIPKAFAEELRDCQRYYYDPFYNATSTLQGVVNAGQCFSSTAGGIAVQFPVQMRIPPTATLVGNMALTDVSGANIAITSLLLASSSLQASRVEFSVAGGLVAGNATMLKRNGDNVSTVSFDAEL